ncbi:hypothetical protein F8G81_10135 [Arthrobacter sp. CDRTa11]|uniref:hypothetical protein n=1 Tax=Arthrobacter sp. CDRTa11 TaxID=2651199 RepID=UPI002265E682|nr:hypothetical protein [Arthrobacter sp. CDRTa11]UZX02919.1 hypothetical protein F8G81_10135 [Arthrobacter sp. CDRTa11]
MTSNFRHLRTGSAAAPATAAAALDLLGEVLPGLEYGLIGQRDLVEMINRDRGVGQPHPQLFAERRRGIDRDDLHGQALLKAQGEHPVP